MSNETHSVPMKRFWFCPYRPDPLFHAQQDCYRLKNNVTEKRDLDQLAQAHIPMDTSEIGEPPKLRFCTECGTDDPFN
ncbi:hypothetical protein [Haladaptatus sp. DFWS20]|uniref:hypothetical protein n=1 Tax=Haladaptatus sp. DFWS20 TaxID=3403467 RepID=UPI003EB820EB